MSEADLDAIERSHQRALAAARPFGRGALVGAEADRHDLLAEVRRLRDGIAVHRRARGLYGPVNFTDVALWNLIGDDRE